MHAHSNISALPGRDFFLLRLSPAQLACMNLCAEKVQSNLSCECLLAESRGGLDTSERSGCVIRAEARKEEKYRSVTASLCLFIFSFSVMFWMVWLLWTPSSYWAASVWNICRFEGRWWSGSLQTSGLESNDPTDCASVFKADTTASVTWRWTMLVLTSSTKPMLIFIDFLSSGREECQTSFIPEVFGETTFSHKNVEV